LILSDDIYAPLLLHVIKWSQIKEDIIKPSCMSERLILDMDINNSDADYPFGIQTHE